MGDDVRRLRGWVFRGVELVGFQSRAEDSRRGRRGVEDGGTVATARLRKGDWNCWPCWGFKASAAATARSWGERPGEPMTLG